jgi:DNA-directed RNA polymerase beta' subunit
MITSKTGGPAIHDMLAAVDIGTQLSELKRQVHETKSVSKRDDMIRQIKYLSSLDKSGTRPEQAYVLHNIPIIPPMARPITPKAGQRIEYADVTHLYKDHMLVANRMAPLVEDLDDSSLIAERSALYDGAKALMGVGEAITGASRGNQLKGFLKQIGGESGPKTGLFQSKILSKKQDFSGRATIYAEPNLGFNEMAVPVEMIWTMYEFHIIRDLVKSGYSYVEAKKAVEERTPAAKASFSKLIKYIPMIANRAPTLMQSNITAHFPVPIKGKTLGINPIHLPMYAGDFDGDALTVHVPITPEAIEEAKKKLLPDQHIYDFRKGLGNSLIAPGHEAILGSMHLTEPDEHQEVREFETENDVVAALKRGEIEVNTPIRLKSSAS